MTTTVYPIYALPALWGYTRAGERDRTSDNNIIIIITGENHET